MEKIDIRSLFPEEIREILAREGIEAYRAGQIFSWIGKGAASFEEMTNLSKPLRARLNEIFYFETMKEVQWAESKLDPTRKFLFTLRDGEHVESVLLSYEYGWSVCLSTQAGCKMGCKFCASSRLGFGRNLKASEILSQMFEITRVMRKTDPAFRISHVVLMGIGEPLDNYENVLRFLRLVNQKDGFGISMRNLSLSTCGLVNGIRRLQEENLPITLSISLHASNDRDRDELMPVNRRFPIAQLIGTAKEYTEKTGRRISFEYAVIAGKNDTPRNVRELKALLGPFLNHLNLIPVNPVPGTPFQPADKAAIASFAKALQKEGLNVTVRRTLGADISAACGQLRRAHTSDD